MRTEEELREYLQWARGRVFEVAHDVDMTDFEDIPKGHNIHGFAQAGGMLLRAGVTVEVLEWVLGNQKDHPDLYF